MIRSLRGTQTKPATSKRTRKAWAKVKQSPPKNLLDRLSGHKRKCWHLCTTMIKPFDNNHAERDVRMMKLRQKISDTFRTAGGADVFCSIRGGTYLQRGRTGAVCSMRLPDALRGDPFIPSGCVGEWLPDAFVSAGDWCLFDRQVQFFCCKNRL
jgi:hypothetical protein